MSLRDGWIEYLSQEEPETALADIRQALIDLLDVFQQTDAEYPVIYALSAFDAACDKLRSRGWQMPRGWIAAKMVGGARVVHFYDLADGHRGLNVRRRALGGTYE